MAWIEGVRGVLLDVDGTLIVGDEAVPGAAEALTRLRDRGIARRLTTNTTRRPRSAVAAVLRREGFVVEDEEVIAPSILARRRILESGRTRAALFVNPDARVDFEGVTPGEDRPDWVVIGDLGRDFTWEVVNRIYRLVSGGAAPIALQKGRVWYAGKVEGTIIDAGPFVAAVEYAAEVEAEVMGKPGAPFFELALGELGLQPSEVLVVGDDVVNDGRGAADAGCRTALVRTGKFSDEALARSGFTPDLLLDSVADVG